MFKIRFIIFHLLLVMLMTSSIGAQLRTASPNAPYCSITRFADGIQPVVEHGAASTFYYLQKFSDKPYPENQRWTKMIWVHPRGEVLSHTYNDIEEFLYVFEGKGTITLNGKSHEMYPGMGIFIPPGITCSYVNTAQDEGNFDNWLKIISAAAGCSPPIGGEVPVIKTAQDTVPVVAYFAGLDWRVHLKWDENSRYPEHLFFASRAILTPGLSFNSHVHPDHEETYFILRGHGHMELDNVRYEIGPMTNVYFPPGVDHEIINDGDEVIDIIAWGVHTRDVGVFGTRTVPQPAGKVPDKK